jgi:hypothetical protein
MAAVKRPSTATAEATLRWRQLRQLQDAGRHGRRHAANPDDDAQQMNQKQIAHSDSSESSDARRKRADEAPDRMTAARCTVS